MPHGFVRVRARACAISARRQARCQMSGPGAAGAGRQARCTQASPGRGIPCALEPHGRESLEHRVRAHTPA
eukprot:13753997-Alexandrium_andersonii.AAC.1